MKIEIWSDIMCPFCYIGKRKFEAALDQFEHKSQVQIEWKSFQLMPELETQEGRNLDEFLSEEKGIALDKAKAMNRYAAQMAAGVGLKFNFDKAIPANTFNAHRLLHFAKANGKQNELEEVLFRSYFTEGKNIDALSTLIEAGKEVGLDEGALTQALKGESFAKDVHADIYEAQQIGVRGVPFFVFDRKQAISGAQDSEAFLETLQQSFAAWRSENQNPNLQIKDGEVCKPDGTCD